MSRVAIEYNWISSSEYAKDRADKVKNGWDVIDVNLTEKDTYFNGLLIAAKVKGVIVYETNGK